MSDLFTNYFDSFGNILYEGSTVAAKTCGGLIYGTVVEIIPKGDNDAKYKIVPNIGCSKVLLPKLKKSYLVSDKNVFLIIAHKKN